MLRRRTAIIACSLLLLLFALLSYTAVLTKSATMDEPVEALGAWTQFHLHDFRMNFEHPPLWHYIAALPNGKNSIQFNPNDKAWLDMPVESTDQLVLAKRTLYQTPGNDGAAFINRARFIMLLLSVALGALVATWTWQLAGPAAALIATALFALDPNLIGHAALVKNDMAMALAMAATFFTVWRVGTKATAINIIALALIVAAAVNTKFSAVLLPPMLVVLLAMRAVWPAPWIVGNKVVFGWIGKTAIAGGLLAVTAFVSFAGIWSCYGFRFRPSPDPQVELNRSAIREELLTNRYQSTHAPPAIADFDPALPVTRQLEELSARIDSFHRDRLAYEQIVHHQDALGITHGEYLETLPQAQKNEDDARFIQNAGRQIVAGMSPALASAVPNPQLRLCLALNNMSSSLRRAAWQLQIFGYLAQIPPNQNAGWIPHAINFAIDHRLLPSAWLNGLLKVHAESTFRGAFLLGQTSGNGWWYYFPLAMIFKTPIIIGIAILFSLGVAILFVVKQPLEMLRQHIWPAACIFAPFAIYFVTALTSHADIGWRYLIPIYPLMYIAAGVLLSLAIQRWRKPALYSIGLLGMLLCAQTLLAWPNYIAFFNLAAGGARGGLTKLSDSNLDWGQDLPLLAKWQDEHPNIPLALAYFGLADPAYYGIDALALVSGYPDPQISASHVLAVSATKIQNPYQEGYDIYQHFHPNQVLGGTIYLYDLRPSMNGKP